MTPSILRSANIYTPMSHQEKKKDNSTEKGNKKIIDLKFRKPINHSAFNWTFGEVKSFPRIFKSKMVQGGLRRREQEGHGGARVGEYGSHGRAWAGGRGCLPLARGAEWAAAHPR